MTPDELTQLGPYFHEGERYTSGDMVNWEVVNFGTMRYVWVIRNLLGAPVQLVRGPHPNRPEAVDFYCPTVPYKRLVMAVLRLPCSYGFYSGASVHVDTRSGDPARWLAIKEDELEANGFVKPLVTGMKDGWVYLSWSYPTSFDALALVCDLATRKQTAAWQPRMV